MPLNATHGDSSSPTTAAVAEPPQGGSAMETHAEGISDILSRAKRVVERQGEIWLAQVKIAALRIAIMMGLMAAALAFVVLGLIFLLIGLFRILTDVFHIAPVWASLLFAAMCGLIAGLCIIPIIFTRKKKRAARPARLEPTP